MVYEWLQDHRTVVTAGTTEGRRTTVSSVCSVRFPGAVPGTKQKSSQPREVSFVEKKVTAEILTQDTLQKVHPPE